MAFVRKAALYCFAASAVASACHAAQTIPISGLNLTNATQGWGSPGVNITVDKHPLTLGGKVYASGFGTHSPGFLLIKLSGGSDHFHAVTGVDDETQGKGSVVFSVDGDGKELWTSGVVHGGDASQTVDVNITGVKYLILKVGDAGDGYNYDHADWADATLHVTGALPETQGPEYTDPLVAPAVTVAAPQFHGASIIGALTGQAFSFALPVTGVQPLHYRADHLPSGVTLSADGILSGMVTTTGTYKIGVQATNANGKASEKLLLNVGNTQALTPPMGWNSYDGYGDNVTEAEILSNADAIARSLKAHGWQYVVVDYRWYDPGAHDNNSNARAGADLTMDKYGRLMPAVNRFPSASDGQGFKALADKIHAMGLKFGIHIMRGIPRNAVNADLPIEGSSYTAKQAYHADGACGWCPDMYPVSGDTPAGQAYYDSLFRLYASWGLDFVKVDDLSAPYHKDEVDAVRSAIDKCGRAIVFSTSPGETPIEDADSVSKQANQWRITGDMWDNWPQLLDNMNAGRAWYLHGSPGHWPDTDMLPLGRLSVGNRSIGADRTTNLSKSEQVMLLTYDALMPAPLMLGGDYSHADDWETTLLTNDEFLAVHQDALGAQGHQVYDKNGIQVWVKPLEDGATAVGIFNTTPLGATPSIALSAIGLNGSYEVRDVWQRKNAGKVSTNISSVVPAHGAVLLRLKP